MCFLRGTNIIFIYKSEAIPLTGRVGLIGVFPARYDNHLHILKWSYPRNRQLRPIYVFPVKYKHHLHIKCKLSRKSSWTPAGMWDVEDFTFCRQQANKIASRTDRAMLPRNISFILIPLMLFSVRCWCTCQYYVPNFWRCFKHLSRNLTKMFVPERCQSLGRCLVAEPQESDHDYKPVGGAVMVWLQAALGTQGVWRGAYATRAIGPHLEARHRPLQQVSSVMTHCRTSDALQRWPAHCLCIRYAREIYCSFQTNEFVFRMFSLVTIWKHVSQGNHRLHLQSLKPAA
jgi:hypothetical protein